MQKNRFYSKYAAKRFRISLWKEIVSFQNRWEGIAFYFITIHNVFELRSFHKEWNRSKKNTKPNNPSTSTSIFVLCCIAFFRRHHRRTWFHNQLPSRIIIIPFIDRHLLGMILFLSLIYYLIGNALDTIHCILHNPHKSQRCWAVFIETITNDNVFYIKWKTKIFFAINTECV